MSLIFLQEISKLNDLYLMDTPSEVRNTPSKVNYWNRRINSLKFPIEQPYSSSCYLGLHQLDAPFKSKHLSSYMLWHFTQLLCQSDPSIYILSKAKIINFDMTPLKTNYSSWRAIQFKYPIPYCHTAQYTTRNLILPKSLVNFPLWIVNYVIV